jgi:hypothetical protein
MNEYALYVGDNYIADGTAKQIAEKMCVKIKTVWFWQTPSYAKRRGKYEKAKFLIKLEGEAGE